MVLASAVFFLVQFGRHGVGLVLQVAGWRTCCVGVPSPLLLRGERSRCASFSAFGRPCDYAAEVPAVLRKRGGASVSVLRQSALTFSCATEASTCSANCAKAGDSTAQFFDGCWCARCCALTGDGDCPVQKMRRLRSYSSSTSLVHVLVVMQRLVPVVQTVQKTVECPQLVLLLDMVVDVPLLATSWSSRGSAAAVPRLVCQLMAMMSS